MSTISQLITRAFRKIGVVARDEPMTADQSEAGLNAFNDMYNSWPSHGVYVSGGEYGLGDSFPLSPKYAEPAMYQLAARLAEDYGAPLTFDPDASLRVLQAGLMCRDVEMKVDPAITTRRRRGI